jgi:prepilin-type N-terminal cleavage/methylation domain-containing protein
MSLSRDHRPHAFTLLEVLVAISLFAVAVSGLLVLFPVAHVTERESDEETRATIIASGIMEVLEIPSRGGCCRIPCGMSNGCPIWEPIDPVTMPKRSVAYDASCEALHAVTEGEYAAPLADPRAVAIATVHLATNAASPRLIHAEVTVASPASAPAEKRSLHRYVKLLAAP